MAECCLVFEEKYEHIFLQLVNGVLRKSGARKKEIKYVRQDGSSPVTAEGMAFRKMIAAEHQDTAMFKLTFNDMIVKLMDSRNVSIGQLAESTGLSDETIKNMRNDPDRHFAIESIVAVCIALHLPPETSARLIDSSPAKFMNSVEMSAYRYVLNFCYTQEVKTVNRFLVEAGFKPLSRIVEGYGEDGVRLEA